MTPIATTYKMWAASVLAEKHQAGYCVECSLFNAVHAHILETDPWLWIDNIPAEQMCFFILFVEASK